MTIEADNQSSLPCAVMPTGIMSDIHVKMQAMMVDGQRHKG